MNEQDGRFPWKVYAAELVGTALLVAAGLSVVIIAFGRGSPVVHLLPSEAWRRCVTGFLFGTIGMAIALSPLGKESGAHINPVVTLGFWMMGKMRTRHALGYVACQLAGGVAGAVPLLAWGEMGRSVLYGATTPGAGYGALWAFAGEAVTTFALVFGLFFFLRHRLIKHYAPELFPPLYAVMVWLEAPISGTSTNPARSLGPAVISGDWHGWWVYWAGPLVGSVLGIAAHRLAGRPWLTIAVAKVHHFEHDRYGIFHFRARWTRGFGARI